LIFPSVPSLNRATAAIEVPFEIVVVCRQDDLLLHPGGYRLTTQAIRPGDSSQPESLLSRELRAMVRRRAQVDPMIRPRPSIKFRGETNGGATFGERRRQAFSWGLAWPMSLQVAGPQEMGVLRRETR